MRNLHIMIIFVIWEIRALKFCKLRLKRMLSQFLSFLSYEPGYANKRWINVEWKSTQKSQSIRSFTRVRKTNMLILRLLIFLNFLRASQLKSIWTVVAWGEKSLARCKSQNLLPPEINLMQKSILAKTHF